MAVLFELKKLSERLEELPLTLPPFGILPPPPV
jgi:hypothetical protein